MVGHEHIVHAPTLACGNAMLVRSCVPLWTLCAGCSHGHWRVCGISWASPSSNSSTKQRAYQGKRLCEASIRLNLSVVQQFCRRPALTIGSSDICSGSSAECKIQPASELLQTAVQAVSLVWLHTNTLDHGLPCLQAQLAAAALLPVLAAGVMSSSSSSASPASSAVISPLSSSGASPAGAPPGWSATVRGTVSIRHPTQQCMPAMYELD
jgi:hypothetical protein